jgi:DNA-binding CsgD family transcriptional regulator
MAGVIAFTVNKTEKKSDAYELSQPEGAEEESSSFELLESIVEKRAGPGILLLTSSNQLLYKDRQAWELCAQLHHGTGKSSNGALPPAIIELANEVNRLLQIWPDAKDWEQIRIKRVIGNPDHPILLSGLGLPDRHGLQQARILITLEEIGRRNGAVIRHVKEMFRLTEREVTVVENLLKGWTNKEIANEIGVTEQTVKEHIKHVMAKTKTTTRTGILVQVLRL